MEEVSEAEVMAACGAGQILECADGGTRRPVRAALLRRCCDELNDQVNRYGIRLRSAAIAGSLDLSGLDVPFPLIFEDCEFDSPLIVEGATVRDWREWLYPAARPAGKRGPDPPRP